MKWFYLALFLAVFRSGFGDEDVFEECVHHEVCVEEAGFEKAVDCASLLSDPDREMILKCYQVFFPDAIDVESVIKLSCADRKKGREAVNYYYDEKMKADKEMEQPAEQKKMMVEARGCFFMMIEDCRTKRVMGLID